MSRTRIFQYPAQVEPVYIQPPATLTELSWAPSYPVQTRRRPRLNVSRFYIPVVEPILPPDPGTPEIAWAAEYPASIQKPKTIQYKAYTAPIDFTPPVPEVTLDKWWHPASRPVLRRQPINRGTQWFTHTEDENVFQDPEVITLDKWFQPASQPVLRPPNIIPQQKFVTYEGEPTLFEDPEIVTLEKWYRPASTPVHRAKRVPSGTQFFFFTESDDFHSNPEIVTMEKWYRPASVPVLPRPVRVPYYPTYFRVEQDDVFVDPDANFIAGAQNLWSIYDDYINEELYYRRQAVTGYGVVLVDKNLLTPVTAGAVTVYVTKDGGTQTTLTDTPVHKGNGVWTFNLTADEMDGKTINLIITHPDAWPQSRTLRVNQ